MLQYEIIHGKRASKVGKSSKLRLGSLETGGDMEKNSFRASSNSQLNQIQNQTVFKTPKSMYQESYGNGFGNHNPTAEPDQNLNLNLSRNSQEDFLQHDSDPNEVIEEQQAEEDAVSTIENQEKLNDDIATNIGDESIKGDDLKSFKARSIQRSRMSYGQSTIQKKPLNKSNLEFLNKNKTLDVIEEKSSKAGDDQSIFQRRRQSDQLTTISTKQVKSKIQKYAETIIPPAVLSQGVNLNPLQLDHLKRLIRQLEDEALEAKRIAKEAKLQNEALDQRVLNESHQEELKKNQFKKQILSQIKVQEKSKKVQHKLEVSIPHIQGDQGYPQIHELTKEERIQLKLKQQEEIKKSLQAQINQNSRLKNESKITQLEEQKLLDLQLAQRQLEIAEQVKLKNIQKHQEMEEDRMNSSKVKHLKELMSKELRIDLGFDKIEALNMKNIKPQEDVGVNDRYYEPVPKRIRGVAKTTAGSLLVSPAISPQNLFDIEHNIAQKIEKKREQNRMLLEKLQDQISESQSVCGGAPGQKTETGRLGHHIRSRRVSQLNQSINDKQASKTVDLQNFPWEDRLKKQ